MAEIRRSGVVGLDLDKDDDRGLASVVVMAGEGCGQVQSRRVRGERVERGNEDSNAS